MNEQTKLSAEDAAILQGLQFRGEMLKRDQQILQLETRLFQARVAAAYGNPNEAIEIAPDGSLIRRPTEATAKE